MEGKLLEATNEKVVVERNGRPVTIALNLLSKEDQEFVKELVVQLEAEAKLSEKDKERSGGFEEGPYAEFVKGEW